MTEPQQHWAKWKYSAPSNPSSTPSESSTHLSHWWSLHQQGDSHQCPVLLTRWRHSAACVCHLTVTLTWAYLYMFYLIAPLYPPRASLRLIIAHREHCTEARGGKTEYSDTEALVDLCVCVCHVLLALSSLGDLVKRMKSQMFKSQVGSSTQLDHWRLMFLSYLPYFIYSIFKLSTFVNHQLNPSWHHINVWAAKSWNNKSAVQRAPEFIGNY